MKMEEKVRIVVGRNPFLSRAGFDMEKGIREDLKKCRNPFLSRAGFDRRGGGSYGKGN